jgi:hypothetical protein
MPVDPNGLFEALSNALVKLPSAMVAGLLLGGPTLIWLIARFVNPPDLRKTADLPVDLLWVCGSCLSINEDRHEYCYRCHRIRAAESVPIVIHGRGDGAARIGIAVGPGLSGEPNPTYGWLGGEFTATTRPTRDRGQPEEAAAPADSPASYVPSPAKFVPSPAGFEPLILEPRVVKVSRRASGSLPAGRGGQRQPQGAGDAKTKRNSRTPGS